MNEAAIRAAFESRLDTATGDAVTYPILSVLPITYENTPNRTDDRWIRTQLILLDSSNGIIGAQNESNPYIRHVGEFVISVFTKLNIGTKVASDISDELITLFQNKTFSGIWTRVVDTKKLGDDTFGYYHINLSFPFTTVT